MASNKDNSPLDPEIILPKLNSLKTRAISIFADKKRAIVIIVAILLVLFGISNIVGRRKTPNGSDKIQSAVLELNKSFDFPALNNSGKPVSNKIKLTISKAEKTNQVLVNDKIVIAKNNKLFLIVQLELKNDATIPLNILPGDLMRLTVGGNDDNKFAPDLHNNLVPIAAISTKLDRIGFVIPDTAKEFKFYVGEIEGKKEEIRVGFPS